MQVEEDILKEFVRTIDLKESFYSPIATKNKQYLRRKHKKEEDPIRPPFFRDADRIIHSKAYARYIDKTQVFFLVDNDHITHRVLHVQLVSKIARTIGRVLRLNEDLIEAISLGHDIGHVPYGHLGEKILSKLCEEHKIGVFLHNVQSVQFLDTIEDHDLTLQVLDGILCHDGEIHNQSLKPTGNADWDTFQSKIKEIKAQKGKNVFPLTMEGCAVRIADTIAYLGRDLKDAMEVNLISENLTDFPENCRRLFEYEPGKDINWAILEISIKDVINNSFGQDTLSFSDDVSECIRDCKEFNYKYIYKNSSLVKEEKKINNMYRIIFNICINDLKDQNEESLIYSDMINVKWISSEYLKEAKPTEIVRDYIAGMTDRYFERVFKKMTNPIPDRVIGSY
ncbi:MAG: HD domain-containing protein [Candidatus Methanoperedens sp.]|nr:HD domain-containing protein [Candidatus Methanoperedens sp.]